MTQDRPDPAEHEARLLELIELLRDEAISDHQFAELQDLVVNDPEVRKTYVDAMALQSNLEWTPDIIDTTQPMLESPALEEDNEPEDLLLGLSCLSSLSDNPWGCLTDEKDDSPLEGERGLWGSISLMVDQAMNSSTGFTIWVSLIVLIPIGLLFLVMSRPPVEYVPMFAKITEQTSEAQWGEVPGAPLQAGSDLTKGQKYTLQSGLAEIMFANGARVVVHGPTTFVPTDSHLVQLDSGRCVAHVPQSASGFTIDANGTRVVDLGTEFGIETNADMETDVYVFKGKVELSLEDSLQNNKLELTENEGVRSSIQNGIARHAKVSTERFVRTFSGRGTPSSHLIRNASFEQPNLVCDKPDGILRSLFPIYWMAPQNKQGIAGQRGNPAVGFCVWTSEQELRTHSGVTDGKQAAALMLHDGTKPATTSNKEIWIYYALGKMSSQDIGHTLKVQVDCLAKSTKQGLDAEVSIAFATDTTQADCGTFVGTTGQTTGARIWKNEETLEAWVSVTREIVEQELFIILRTKDASPGSEDIYLFDNVKLLRYAP